MEQTIIWLVCIFVVGSVIIRALHVPRPVPKKQDLVRLLHSTKFQNGDVILFHSNPWIQGVADGLWSHVGVVVIGKSGIPRLFDITGGNHYATAAPLIPVLEKELRQGDRVVAFRRFHPRPPTELLCHFARDCVRHKVPYEHVYWRAGFQRMFGKLFPVDTAHGGVGSMCSSIVCDALKASGVLASTVNSYEILPSDFGMADIATRIPLHAPFEWGKLVFLRMKNRKTAQAQK